MIKVEVVKECKNFGVDVFPQYVKINIDKSILAGSIATANAISAEESAKEAREILQEILQLDIRVREKRHSWEIPYSYIGFADTDSLESDAVWTISRMEIEENGSSERKIALGAWSNRTNLIYV